VNATTANAPPTKAKRGDLVIVVQEHHDYIIGKGAQGHTTCEIGVVSSVTREGLVKAFRWARYYGEAYDDPTLLARMCRVVQTPIVPASVIDVPAAMAAAKAHQWPSGGTMPFESLDEVREALRPHLLQQPASTGGRG
jgi:hypothetical protein